MVARIGLEEIRLLEVLLLKKWRKSVHLFLFMFDTQERPVTEL